jgi:hypothetical protein
MILMLLSGAWGKVINEKNLKQKSRDTVPLNESNQARAKFILAQVSERDTLTNNN